MEFHQLRYVCAIADTGNFSRAAERCQIAQPSLSQQVLKLEEELGTKLFDRLGRSIRLTEAGRAFIPRARAILHQMDAARSSCGRSEYRPSRQRRRGRDSNRCALSDTELCGAFRQKISRREIAHRGRNHFGPGGGFARPLDRCGDSRAPATPQGPGVVPYTNRAALCGIERKSSACIRKIAHPQRPPRRIVRDVARRPLFS